MTHESLARDAEFLHDLAGRLFRNATPSMGFDQGDVDQLYRIASALTTPSQDYARGIEDAARDGTPVLIWSDWWNGSACIAQWNDYRYGNKPISRWESRDRIYGRRAFIDKPPAYWMPLPAAPKEIK